MPQTGQLYWLTWTPADGQTPLVWAVRLIRDRDEQGGYLGAWTADEEELHRPPSWTQGDDGVWHWRGQPGYQGRKGTVEVRPVT